MEVIANNFTYFMIGAYPEGPLGGLAYTIYLAVVSCLLSFFGGLIAGLARSAKSRSIRIPATVYVEVVRGMPLLMVIFWIYFLLPTLLKRPIPESTSVIAALVFFTSAYMAEIVRAGIQSIPKGQMEAALSTGMSHNNAMLYIILPQALRNMIPSFINQFISLTKDTSLAFIVGVNELTHVATQVNNRTLTYPTVIFAFIAVLYFIVCYNFSILSRWTEKKLAWKKVQTK